MLAQLRARLGSELDRLSHELTTRMAMDIARGATGAGDDAGVVLKRVLQERIRFLGQLVAGLAFVDPRQIWTDRAGYGSVARVRDLSSGAEDTYTLMTGDLIDVNAGQVSLASPIGHALLGRKEGETVTVVTPTGVRRYRILDLSTLPQRMGVAGEAARAPEPPVQLQAV